ncbi:bifunctional riboflavin kinase/FAD synthetase [Merdibacter massiliensis]|uniref:bifunctional riboflavin kinase/FAD synthetase n=1 Tax=Merdibacter massiliensis TaxID=1871030 RepID=UPI00096A9147|nr:bifunctional riboflavin kinase/FAD synthetase [Merdibacter massiliensis]
MEIKVISLDTEPFLNQMITACIGYFDGLHLGHQQLIKEVVESAAKDGTLPAMITFDPDPWVVLRGMHDPAHLTTMEDREKIAEKMGIKLFLILDFTKEMASMEIPAFHSLLVKHHITKLICGYDFHYGKYGSGSVQTLRQQHDFEVSVIDPITYEGVRISSTLIEQLIMEGNVYKASVLLGRYYFLRGIVARGYRRGTTMHFPTANLALNANYLIPKNGVYAGLVLAEDTIYEAMINVGNNPTFGNDNVTIEANLFDFHEMIYDQPVTFYFVQFIREEKRFESQQDLIWQLKNDQEHIHCLFLKHPNWKEDSLCV